MSRLIPKTEDGFPFWTIALIGALIGTAMLLLWHFKIQPFFGWWDGLYSRLTAIGAGISQQLNISNMFDTIGKSIQENPLAFAVTAISGVGAVWGIIGKIRADHLKHQTEVAATEQLNQMDNYYNQKLASAEQRLDGVVALETKISALEGELTNTDNLKAQLLIQENKLQGKQETIENLMQQIENLKVNTFEKVVVK